MYTVFSCHFVAYCMYVHVHVFFKEHLENKCGSVCVHVFTLDLLCSNWSAKTTVVDNDARTCT